MQRRSHFLLALVCVGFSAVSHALAETGRFQTFSLPAGDYPHSAAPGPDGTILYTDQRRGGFGTGPRAISIFKR